MRPLRTPAALTPIETLLDHLQAAGLRPPHAIAAYRLIASYARGFALAELQGFTLDTPNPNDRHPPAINTARHAGTTHNHDQAFRLGIETIIAGLRNTAASGKARQ